MVKDCNVPVPSVQSKVPETLAKKPNSVSSKLRVAFITEVISTLSTIFWVVPGAKIGPRVTWNGMSSFLSPAITNWLLRHQPWSAKFCPNQVPCKTT